MTQAAAQRIFGPILASIQAQPAQLRMAAYVSALRRHDWQHEASEDHAAWLKGRESLAWLRDEARVIDPDFKVWNSIAPMGYLCGGVA